MSDADVMALSQLSDGMLQIAGSITSSAFGYHLTKELAQFQNDMNIENWKMANEYNSPANQMQRFAAAGLNPNLIYGQGNPGNTSPVSTQVHQADFVKNPFAGVQLFQGYQQAKALALDNEQQVMRNSEERLAMIDRVRSYNAIEQFVEDHIESRDGYEGAYYLGWDKDGRIQHIEGNYADAIRKTPQYKQLELMWQKGQINAENIGFLNAKKALTGTQQNVLSFNEQRNQLLADVMKGDMNGDNFKKLLTLLLINLLESSTSPSVLGTVFH